MSVEYTEYCQIISLTSENLHLQSAVSLLNAVESSYFEANDKQRETRKK